jgi:hypothetical protein
MGREETMAQFEVRVLERTGMALAAIPVGDPEDVIGGHIVARHEETSIFVFYVGYPAWEDEDGTQFWVPQEAARQVVL